MHLLDNRNANTRRSVPLVVPSSSSTTILPPPRLPTPGIRLTRTQLIPLSSSSRNDKHCDRVESDVESTSGEAYKSELMAVLEGEDEDVGEGGDESGDGGDGGDAGEALAVDGESSVSV
jgi:hypothetical protein